MNIKEVLLTSILTGAIVIGYKKLKEEIYDNRDAEE